jgi:hypothetical protein
MVSSHDTLEDYVRTNFNLMYFHNMRLEELEGMMPWERDVYVTLLIQRLKEEEQEHRNDQYKEIA